MVWESCRFCSGERPRRTFRLSRSRPEQKALPAPVRMRTKASDFATSSRARCRSSISSKLIALRLSGRFRVRVAMLASYASRIVLKSIIKLATHLTDFNGLRSSSSLRNSVDVSVQILGRGFNLRVATPKTLLRFLLLLSTAYPAASVLVILRHAVAVLRLLFLWECCRRVRPGRRDNHRGLPARNRSGGIRHHTPRESFLPPDRGGCADALRSRGNHTLS